MFRKKTPVAAVNTEEAVVIPKKLINDVLVVTAAIIVWNALLRHLGMK